MKNFIWPIIIVILVILILLLVILSPQKEPKENLIEVPMSREITYQSADGSFPALIKIEKLGIESNIQYVGITTSGKMATPEGNNLYKDVGWYRYGPKPGDVGNSVIAGHFDNGYGLPAVFYEIENLNIGDKIQIEYDSGDTLTFEIKEKEIYNIDSAPLEKIFGETEKRMLNLITCNGEWSVLNQEYDQRTVIFAELIETD